MLIRNIIMSFILCSFYISAQNGNLLKSETVPQTILYPGVTGKDLRDSLVINYKPVTVLNYDNARDKLFGEIYNAATQVTCVYTGWSITVDPGSSTAPRTQAHNQGCNTEHTYPQSKGALSGNANTDLHHLFPVRADVNSSRGNYPYAEISNVNVNRWWRLDGSTTSIPTSNIEEYSRTGTAQFQVRDNHKGNAARAVFYFYTMYKTEAENADPNFFAQQVNDLILWHKQDLVDINESDRTYAKSIYQNNKVNPYIIDTTLARRSFGIQPPVQFTAVSQSSTQINLSWESNSSVDDVLIVWNQTGIFSDPVDGITYTHGQSALSGSIILPASGNSSFLHSGLSAGTFYYKIFSYNTATERYSVGYVKNAATGTPFVMHYWNFNSSPGVDWGFNQIDPTSSIGGGLITHNFTTGPEDFGGTTINNENNDIAGTAFCPQGAAGLVNNSKYILVELPTTNYENIILSYATQRTSTGFTTQTVSYSLNGTFNDEEIYETLTGIGENFELKIISFVNVAGVDHNQNFKIKITFDGATTNVGNNRIDNLKVSGNLISTRNIAVIGNNTGEISLSGPAENKPFFSFRMNNNDERINFTALTVKTQGTYSTSYINGYKLWKSFLSEFDITDAEQIGLTVQSDTANGETVFFNGFSDEISDVEKYYFITVDLSGSVSNGSQIKGIIENFNSLSFDYPAASHSSNNFPIEGSIVPLPVELTSFYANPGNNNSILLLWSTASELNNFGFNIDRKRISQIEGYSSDWKIIGFVEGAGTKNSETKYLFNDTEFLNSGTYYYRLKQIDINGEYTYSHIVEVVIGKPDNYELFQNYPNPFNPSTIIKYSIPEDNFVTLKLFDIMGKEVATLLNNEWQEAGIHRYEFTSTNLKDNRLNYNLSSGVYFYKLVSGKFSNVMKMILLR